MKNTFQLLTDTINHLQKLADNLGDLNKFKDAAQPELTRDTGKPKIEGDYFWIGNKGFIHKSDIEIDSDFEIYNSFHTKQAAETEAAYTLASRRVRAFAKAVNGDWKADSNNEEEQKFGIIYTGKEMYIDANYVYNLFIHQIAFPNKELATKALELFRPEWEILANP
jgi:hypothetical protein